MKDHDSQDRSRSRANFSRALANLQRSIATPVAEPRDLSGIIKDFEMAYELSWKVLKRVLTDAGHATLGAKDVYGKAYRLGYLDEEIVWLKMIEDRKQTSHVYDEKHAAAVVIRIKSDYVPALERLSQIDAIRVAK